MQWYSVVAEAAALVADALHRLKVVNQRLDGPPLRSLAEFGLHEARGKEVREGLGKPRFMARCLCSDRIEVHKPRFEQRPHDRLQRLVHAPIQFDLVVERLQDARDGLLFEKRRNS